MLIKFELLFNLFKYLNNKDYNFVFEDMISNYLDMVIKVNF